MLKVDGELHEQERDVSKVLLTCDNAFERLYNDSSLKKGGVTMCDIVQGFVNEGIEKGIEKGQQNIIINLIKSNAGSIEQIAAWTKLPVKEVEKIAEKVPIQA